MHFNDEELEVIFKALKMNYLDGPDSERHQKELEDLLNTIAKHLGKTDGL